jgi:hypothetical protein
MNDAKCQCNRRNASETYGREDVKISDFFMFTFCRYRKKHSGENVEKCGILFVLTIDLVSQT